MTRDSLAGTVAVATPPWPVAVPRVVLPDGDEDDYPDEDDEDDEDEEDEEDEEEPEWILRGHRGVPHPSGP